MACGGDGVTAAVLGARPCGPHHAAGGQRGGGSQHFARCPRSARTDSALCRPQPKGQRPLGCAERGKSWPQRAGAPRPGVYKSPWEVKGQCQGPAGGGSEPACLHSRPGLGGRGPETPLRGTGEGGGGLHAQTRPLPCRREHTGRRLLLTGRLPHPQEKVPNEGLAVPSRWHSLTWNTVWERSLPGRGRRGKRRTGRQADTASPLPPPPAALRDQEEAPGLLESLYNLPRGPDSSPHLLSNITCCFPQPGAGGWLQPGVKMLP